MDLDDDLLADALVLEPRALFDPALLGVAHRGGEFVAIYSRKKVIEALRGDDEELSEEDAIDHYEFNVSGAMGHGFPFFMVDDD